MKHIAITLFAVTLLGLPALGAEKPPTFPLPQGLYSDGESCGAAEIGFKTMPDLFGVSDVIGSTCELKSVAKQGEAYAFEATCSEGNGSFAHSWRVRSSIRVEGQDGFTFDGTIYRFCSADDAGRTGFLRHHDDRHLPLTAGSYRTGGSRCGSLVYWDNPHAADLGASFGGPDFKGDVCTVKRAVAHDGTVSFASTCIPDRDGALMRISVPTTISVRSPAEFEYAGRAYRLCKKINY